MTPAARIIAHLYAEIDSANERLAKAGAGFEIVRCLDARQVTARTVDVPDAPPLRPAPIDAMPCAVCGEMVAAGGCRACENCGTVSGGCA